jgi:hypothetical protein
MKLGKFFLREMTMIYLKFLSGDLCETAFDSDTAAWRLFHYLPRLPSDTDDRFYLDRPPKKPIAVLFLEDRILQMEDIVPDESVVGVWMRNVFLVWNGCGNSVWTGEGIQCMNVYKEKVEWGPHSAQPEDIVMVDYFSFGMVPPYTLADIMYIQEQLGVKYIPSDFSKESF